MKRKITVLFVITAMLLSFIPTIKASAEGGSCGANVTWELKDGILTISGSGNMDDWNAHTAPWGSQSNLRNSINEVIIESGVTSIGDYAFYDCANLGKNYGSVNIPNTVLHIGSSAFEGCVYVTDISIPNSVTEIETRAFCQCFGLTNISLPQNITAVNERTFCQCKNLQYVSIPEGVTHIDESAFAQCQSLTDITLPESVSEIKDYAFDSCNSLMKTDYLGSNESLTNIAVGNYNSAFTNSQVNCLKPYGILFETIPYSKITVDDSVYYSDPAGRVRISGDDISGDYTLNYTIEKSGHEPLTGERAITADGAVIKAVPRLNEGILYSEDFNNVSDSSICDSLGKNEFSNTLFDVYAPYGGVDLEAASGSLSIHNTDNDTFRSISYPINVKAVNADISMEVTFPENAQSHMIIRDSANQIIGAVYRDADGNTSFGASGKNFSGTRAAGVQTVPVGVIDANIPVEISIGVNVNEHEVIASVGGKLAGISDYAKDITGIDNISSVYIGTDCNSVITVDNIKVKGYTGTDVSIAKAKLSTTPYSRVTINEGIYYSGASGMVEAEYVTADIYPIQYKIEKGGYKTRTGEVSGTTSGIEINAPLELNDGLLYSEDFDTVSVSGTECSLVGGDLAEELFGISAVAGPMKITEKNGALSVYNGSGSGFRTAVYPMRVNTADIEVSFDALFPNGVDSHIILRDSANQILATFYCSAENEITFGASGSAYDTSNAAVGTQIYPMGTAHPGEPVTITTRIDLTNSRVTALIGDKKATVTGYKKAKNGYDDISSIMIGTARNYNTVTIDNLTVKPYVGEAVPTFSFCTIPYAKVTINDKVYYSGASGRFDVEYEADTEYKVVYKVEKNGYNTVEGETIITEADSQINALMTLNPGLVYSEDFGTVSGVKITADLGNDETADSLFGISAKYGTLHLTAEEGRLTIDNTGNGFRSVSYPLNVTQTDFEVQMGVVFPENGSSHIILRDGANQAIAEINRSAEGEVTFGASGNAFNKSNANIGEQAYSLGSVEAGVLTVITVRADMSNKTITAALRDKTAAVTGYKKAADGYNGLSSIFIGTDRKHSIAIDDITIISNTVAPESEIMLSEASTAELSETDSEAEIGHITYKNGMITIPVTVIEGHTADINIYVAEYNSDRSLAQVKEVSETVSESKDINISYSRKIHDSKPVVFVWNGNMKPYCPQTELTEEIEETEESRLLAAAAELLNVTGIDDVCGNITLPEKITVEDKEVSVGWISSKPEVITDKDIPLNDIGIDAYRVMPAGVVTRQDTDTQVTITAVLTYNGAVRTKDFTANVRAKNTEEKQLEAYIFPFFPSNHEEDLYFAAGTDPLHFTDLNGGRKVLTSTVGNEGVRDPYILRSHEGDKYYILSTDLKVAVQGFETVTGSLDMVVWESEDLVNWSESRLVDVGARAYIENTGYHLGCVYAPEAVYDEMTGEYVLIWAGRWYPNYPESYSGRRYKVLYSKTRDFVNFTPAQMYIDRGDGNIIDTSALQASDNKFYRVSADGDMTIERSDYILGEWEKMSDITTLHPLMNGYDEYWEDVGVTLTGGIIEGPELFKFNNEERWGLYADNYQNPGRGYIPMTTTDLSDNTGAAWQLYTQDQFSFGNKKKRHGSILGITMEEYDRLISVYGKD